MDVTAGLFVKEVTLLDFLCESIRGVSHPRDLLNCKGQPGRTAQG